MIRVAILDPHPAMRAGLEAILRERRGIVPVGAAADRHALWPLLYRTDPDVVIVDQLQLCLTVRARHPRPRVVLYAAGAGFDAIVPAAFAGAAAIVDKACGTHELLAAIRGERALPAITPRLQRRAAARLGRHRPRDPRDAPGGHAGPRHRGDRRDAARASWPAARPPIVAALGSGAAVGALDRASQLHAG